MVSSTSNLRGKNEYENNTWKNLCNLSQVLHSLIIEAVV